MTISIFLDRHGKPFVYTGNRLPFDHVHRNVYGGYLDYIQEVLNIFLQKGRRHILLFPQTSYIDFMFYQKAMIQARIEEFIREHDLDSTFCSLGAYAEPGSKDLLDAIDAGLAKNTPADALFFNSVPASITVYNHIQQLGLRIPRILPLFPRPLPNRRPGIFPAAIDHLCPRLRYGTESGRNPSAPDRSRKIPGASGGNSIFIHRKTFLLADIPPR